MTRNIEATGSGSTPDDTVSGAIPRLRLKPEWHEASPRPRGHVDGGGGPALPTSAPSFPDC